jgi:lipopolysaccharide/colanic/teichoic acid biosynthesis glycosyltransferase
MLQLLRDSISSRQTRNARGRSGRASLLLEEPKKEHLWYEKRGEDNVLSLDAYSVAKRVFDLVISVLLFPLALVILTLCYVAIKIDTPGPVFFFQRRTGLGGKPFKVYKLRTMVQNAAELREKLMHLNELKPPDFKITNDPRVTRVGRFLRKTSLDELPQLFNVLKGEMTLVGPRPSSYEAHTYELWHTARFELKPGITGLAQVCGRSELLLDEKLRFDISYWRNMSLWLDCKILWRTVGVVLGGKGVK